MSKLSPNTPLHMRVERSLQAHDAPLNVLERQVHYATAATTHRPPPTVYGPHQKRYRAPLTSHLHFGTAAQIAARNDILDRVKLTPELLAVQRQWGAVYTGALYAKTPRQLKALHEDVVSLTRLANGAVSALAAQLRALKEQENGKQKAGKLPDAAGKTAKLPNAGKANAGATAPDKGAPQKSKTRKASGRGGDAPAPRREVRD